MKLLMGTMFNGVFPEQAVKAVKPWPYSRELFVFIFMFAAKVDPLTARKIAARKKRDFCNRESRCLFDSKLSIFCLSSS